MELDFDDELTRNQSATVPGQLVTATSIGGRVKDAGVARDWAAGEAVFPYAKVTNAAASNPGSAMLIEILGADDANLTVNVAILSSKSVPTASLTAGARIPMPSLQPGFKRRFLGVRFTPSGAAPTTGAFIVGLVRKNARSQTTFSTAF